MAERSKAGLWLSFLAIALCCVGFFIATTLSLTEAHGAVVPCGESSGCAAVSESAYSHLFGLPVAYFGVAGYLGILVLTLWSTHSARALRLALAVTILGMLASLILVAISSFAIHATCRWCVGSAFTMTGLLFITWARCLTPLASRTLPQAVMAIVLVFAGGFWANRIASMAPRNVIDFAALSNTSVSELAPDSSPSLGAPGSPVTIVEFADFACPACRNIEAKLRKLFTHTGGLRLVFRNLPQPSIQGHEASLVGAVCGEIANEHGKFWQFADLAFSTPAEPKDLDYEKALEAVGLQVSVRERMMDKSDPALQAVEADLSLAHRLRIALTPEFIVYAPGQEPKVGTNANLKDILADPKILPLLRSFRPN